MFGVQALTVAMLDDFLLAVPRIEGDEDSHTLTRGQSEGARSDELLRKLNVPPAIEKTQQRSQRSGVGYNFLASSRS